MQIRSWAFMCHTDPTLALYCEAGWVGGDCWKCRFWVNVINSCTSSIILGTEQPLQQNGCPCFKCGTEIVIPWELHTGCFPEEKCSQCTLVPPIQKDHWLIREQTGVTIDKLHSRSFIKHHKRLTFSHFLLIFSPFERKEWHLEPFLIYWLHCSY